MKKISLFVVVLALLVSAGFVAPSAVSAAVTPCINFTSNLSYKQSDASTAGQISILQSFLIAQNYLNVVAPTGYFGGATLKAVTQYQYNHDLPPTGVVDTATRASMTSMSCGNTNYINYNNGYSNTGYGNAGGYYYGGNTGYNNIYYNANGTPALVSLSTYTGPVGTTVTVYGSGFDPSNNTINFGGIVQTGLVSLNGTSITFSVPQIYNNNQYCTYPYLQNCAGSSSIYSVTVSNSRGTSNALQFTVTSGTVYNPINNNCYVYGVYNSSYCNLSPVSLSNVSGPSTLTIDTTGTWSITVYNPNSNYVTITPNWGDQNTYGIYNNPLQTQTVSTQGPQTVTLTHIYQSSGTYNIVFTATSNTGVQVTASATVSVTVPNYIYGGYSNPISLYSISPNSARTGTQVILYGSGFTGYGNTVHFGVGGTMNFSSSNGTAIYYTIPYTVSGCDINNGYGVVCPMYAQQITPGTYPVYVTNSYGQSSGIVYFSVSQY